MMDTLSMVTKKELERLCSSKLGEDYFKSLIDSMKYSVFAGGKAIRPYLVYEFSAASDECDSYIEGCESYAAAVELIHTFSLIHDDLPAMDDDDMRRGKPSNHIVFGEATAILAGDALSLLAMYACASNRQLSPLQNCDAVECLSYYAGKEGMIGGQQLDLDGEKNQLTREKLDLMNSLKTGALIAAACELGCIAGKANEAKKIAAKGYGYYIGRAFQVVDDILDIEGNSAELGKNTGSDLNNNKSTYVSLLGLDGAKQFAIELTENAKKCLDVFPGSKVKQRLLLLADYLLDRKK
ncbi:MAG: hypothetical protein A2Y17_12005 [Clostridiales bacterium GWF2_38_85]|nr:MAG: hypothetical protein A2Y17_12005 [Clostridiales bacterium GWF2_38_85]